MDKETLNKATNINDEIEVLKWFLAFNGNSLRMHGVKFWTSDDAKLVFDKPQELLMNIIGKERVKSMIIDFDNQITTLMKERLSELEKQFEDL